MSVCVPCARLLKSWYHQKYVRDNEIFVNARLLYSKLSLSINRFDSMAPQLHGLLMTLVNNGDALDFKMHQSFLQNVKVVRNEVMKHLRDIERHWNEARDMDWKSFGNSFGEAKLWPVFGSNFRAWALHHLQSARFEVKRLDSV